MNVLEKILEEIENLNYYPEGMECGIEDCGITDRYEACEYGWNKAIEAVIEVINNMDEAKDINVHSNDDWTPTEERQPEKPVFGEDSYIVQTNNIITPFSAFWDGEEWTDVSDDKVKGVIAWQPLPEPYKGEEAAGE